MRINEFAAALAGMTVALHEAEGKLVMEAAEHIAEAARSYLGHEQVEWPPLSESTLEDKRRHGWPVPSPLLRSGELRDSISATGPVRENGHAVAYAGSTSKIAVYQEFGTTHIPPRPFIGLAIDRERDHFHGMILEMVRKSLGGD